MKRAQEFLPLRGVDSYLHSSRHPPALAVGIREGRRLPAALEGIEDREELIELLDDLDPEPAPVGRPFDEMLSKLRAELASLPPLRRSPQAASAPAAPGSRVDPARFQAELSVIDQAKALGIPAASCLELARREPLPTSAELKTLADELAPRRVFAALARRIYARPTCS